MNCPKPPRSIAVSARCGRGLIGAAFGLLCGSVLAQPAPVGTIAGRVSLATSGIYLDKAVVTIVGTSLRALTNDFGEYEIRDVHAGTVTVRAAYTGQAPQSVAVVVRAGATTTQDFRLGESADTSGDATVVLRPFLVESERFKTAEEIAVNEERWSTNLKNVVATDAFGHIADGNLGEFVKFLPGVESEYGDADAFAGAGLGGVNQATASQVSIRGFGAADTAITIDGMPLSGISPAGLTRAVGLDMLSLNNASRIEIIKVARPDMSNESGGGTVNLVTRSAFEYSRPTTTLTVNATFNSEETGFFKKSAGPANKPTYHTLPGGSLNIVWPLSKTMGFAFNVASANSFSPNHQISTTWRTTPDTYNRLPTVNPPPTTTVVDARGNVSDLAHPFLRQATVVDNPWNDFKQSGSMRFDWRPWPGWAVSANYSLSHYEGVNVNRRLQFSAEKPQDWGADYVIGRSYESTPAPALDPGNKGAMEVTARDRAGFAQQGYVKVAYDRGPWTIDASAGRSQTYGEFRDLKNGHLSSIALSLPNVGQVVMRDIRDGTPGALNIFNRAGAPLDYSQLASWTIDNASTLDAKTTKSFQRDTENRYALNVRRALTFLPFALAAKIGFDERVKQQRKWGLGTGYKMRYVGPALTTADILDPAYHVPPGFGFAQPQQWADTYKFYGIYQQHPEWFNPDFDLSYSANNYKTTVQQNKSVKETRDAGYAMLEGALFKNRLTFVAGVRQTQSRVEGYQPFTDTKWNYVKNADGTLYLDSVYPLGVKFDGSTFANASGETVRDVIVTDAALQSRLRAKGIAFPDHLVLGAGGAAGTPSNSLEAQALNFFTRQLATKVRNPITPSVSAAYNLTENLVFKPSWSRTTTMPNLDAGNGSAATFGLLGGYSINENVAPTGTLGGEGTIIVANPTLKPKTTDAWNFQLAYYSRNGGSVSATYYYTVTRNQWESNTLFNTDAAYDQVLASLGLDRASFADWTISTTANGDATSKQAGCEFALRQNLQLLGAWGRRVNVFANFSHKNQKPSAKPGVVQLASTSANQWSGGASIGLNRFSASAKLTYRNAIFNATGSTVTYNVVRYQLYNVTPEEYKVDLDLDYQLTRRYSVWLNGRNIFNADRQRKNWDAASNVMPEYARISSNYRFGVQCTAGVTARF